MRRSKRLLVALPVTGLLLGALAGLVWPAWPARGAGARVGREPDVTYDQRVDTMPTMPVHKPGAPYSASEAAALSAETFAAADRIAVESAAFVETNAPGASRAGAIARQVHRAKVAQREAGLAGYDTTGVP